MKRFISYTALFTTTCCFAQPTSDDYFTNRIFLTGSNVIFTGTTRGASWGIEDPDEPTPAQWAWRSVWWSWTAQEASLVLIERVGNYRTIFAGLGVYAGTNLSTLRLNQACEIDLQRRGHYALFCAQAGTEYQIDLDGDVDELQTFRLMVITGPVFRL